VPELRGTYRVQLRPEFRFEEAAAVTGYLAALGVSHLYCSPYLQAAPGSTHGYDVVDYGWVNEELGGSVAHAGLVEALRAEGLGQVLDIVPNHMATVPENAWWWDVLANGASSRYAPYFDIDWHGPESRLNNKVLLPILETHYGRVLEAGKIRVVRMGAWFQVHCPGHPLPTTPDSVDQLLLVAAMTSASDELWSIAEALSRLPPGTATDPEQVRARERDSVVLLGQLARLLDDRPEVAQAVDDAIALMNADPDTLDVFLERQNYRVAYWRTAGRDLPYRRFFDINTLVGMNMEREDLFEAAHQLVLRFVGEGILDGLRVDHPDGLRDPEGYLRRICDRAPGVWLVVEKILQPGESLPGSWACDGTTGYDFLNTVNGLFVDPAGERPLTDYYEEFTGEPGEFADVARDAKLEVMDTVLASDIARLTELLVRICERHRRYRDYTRYELHEALKAFMASLPVYRTYVDADRLSLSPEDRDIIAAAAGDAARLRPDLDAELFEFLSRLMRLELNGALETELVMRLQQISAAVMAKGVEDTAFYRYHRLVSLNEVGGSPGRFGLPVGAFHAYSAGTARAHPTAMTTLATHDTKRGPDVRARLNLLSEVPDRWIETVGRWTKMNDRHRAGGLPDRNIEYLLYQTLVGTWPIGEERLQAYLQKAAKEAKQHTTWTDPNATYDGALSGFVAAVMADRDFLREVDGFVGLLRGPGWANGLAQLLLLLTAPGVPDIYQGTELWDFSLVDPDNRRPVDFGLRAQLLERLARLRPERLWAEADSGLPKLAVARAALAARRRLPGAFGPAGGYLPLGVSGPASDRVVAFARTEPGGAAGAVTVVPRFVLSLWGDREAWCLEAGLAAQTRVALPPGRFRDALTGREHEGTARLGDLLAVLPAALLLRAEA
jgi:(1->4)-alpha-D-glucan 1-alpha-D-glucosylmutase